MTVPVLKGSALRAVSARGRNLRIIACAGAGKTEVLAQRIASLVVEGNSPETIVAFTFTEKAALELRQRIGSRLAQITTLGPQIPNGLFVGTIHAFCLDLIKTKLSTYETYDVLSELQQTTFVDRVHRKIELDAATPGRSSPKAQVNEFLQSINVLENELIDVLRVREPLRTVISAYYDELHRHNYLTFGLVIRKAVELLESSAGKGETTLPIQHVLVDEYQDVNPAQERLIQLLSQQTPSTAVTVVGDDDQAIYQWRGADSSNLINFSDQFPNTETIEIIANRRSGPEIVRVAGRLVKPITNRYAKELKSAEPNRASSVFGNREFSDAIDEAGWIAAEVERLIQRGTRPDAIAVLCRSARVMKPITEAFKSRGIPTQTKGRGTLLLQRDCEYLTQVISHLADVPWRVEQDSPKQDSPSMTDLMGLAEDWYGLDDEGLQKLETLLLTFASRIEEDSRTVSVVDLLMAVLAVLDIRIHRIHAVEIHRWRYLASLLTIVADFEAVMRRSRRAPSGASQIGGANIRGRLIKNLAWHLYTNVATLDVVDLDEPQDELVTVSTIHGAKGLEWPIVFVPSLTENAFPSPLVGRKQPWLLERDLFASVRYEGDLADERRLMYVAATRAGQVLTLTSHKMARGKPVQTSRFFREVEDLLGASGATPGPFAREVSGHSLELSLSQFLRYTECPKSYVLRDRLGLPSAIVPELGYGTAIHHLLRVVIDRTRSHGALPDDFSIEDIAQEELFFPFATKEIAANMTKKAVREFRRYLDQHSDEIRSATQTELPVSLSLARFRLSGRADLIVGSEDSNYIVDFKSAELGDGAELQLQTYALAMRQSGLQVKQAFIHNVSTGSRTSVDIGERNLGSVQDSIEANLTRLAAGEFPARPDPTRCGRCAANVICAESAG